MVSASCKVKGTDLLRHSPTATALCLVSDPVRQPAVSLFRGRVIHPGAQGGASGKSLLSLAAESRAQSAAETPSVGVRIRSANVFYPQPWGGPGKTALDNRGGVLALGGLRGSQGGG